jgi:hypothetical protein
MQAAAADSQTQAAVLRSALVADTSNDATLNSAENALVSSQTAYLHAETSLYYDEDSSKVAKDAPHAAAFDEVATGLDKTSRHSPLKRSSSAQSAASDTENLQQELTQLAKAWDPSDATNFRNQVFIPSPDDSVARIFQGVIAFTESVLPGEIAQSSEPLSLERINGRLFVVKNLYDGKYIGLNGEFYDGPGLKHLIERKDADTAAEISATIDKAISLAPTTENGGTLNAEELQATLETLTEQLADAAKDLGYKVKRGLR